jgi:4-amino-4-deoxy-L-arabinose transferase-like glycosyltransferase
MNRVLPYLSIIIIGAALFFHSLGSVPLFDWDEINFAESAREMIAEGNYMRVQINFEPFWEKPPFFFWLQSASMQLFGVGSFAARLPNALCGIITLLVIFAIGNKHYSQRMATWWVLIYAASFLPHLYFKSGIIDPWFNLFIFISIYFLSQFLSIRSKEEHAVRWLVLSAVFAGLGIITKGPVALLVILLTFLIYYFLNRKSVHVHVRDYLIWGSGAAMVTLLWFGLEIWQHGWWFINEFITYQIRLAKTEDAGHGGFLLYHFVILLLGCFPASWLMWGRVNASTLTPAQLSFRTLMQASLAVILVVFTLVQTKIVHYSSFAYFPIGYLAAMQIESVLDNRSQFKRWQLIGLLITGLIWGTAFVALPLVGNHPDWIQPLLQKDPFALANLQAQVHWGYHLVLPGLLFFIAIPIVYFLLRSKQTYKGLMILCISCILAMQALLTLYAPRIEQYSQRAAIDFFQSLKGKNVYVSTIGYKSYAPYFYAEVNQKTGPFAFKPDSLLANPVDKPAYFASKITEKERLLMQYPSLKILYEKNGFVFYLKQP